MAVHFQRGDPVEVNVAGTWQAGQFLAYRASEPDEDFDRVDIKTKTGLYRGYDSACVRPAPPAEVPAVVPPAPRCVRCRRVLTEPSSDGLGPECRRAERIAKELSLLPGWEDRVDTFSDADPGL